MTPYTLCSRRLITHGSLRAYSPASSSAQHDIKKTKKEICEGNKQRKFEFKCICDWSKDDKYGFIPNTKCPVHGKQTKQMLSKTIPIR